MKTIPLFNVTYLKMFRAYFHIYSFNGWEFLVSAG